MDLRDAPLAEALEEYKELGARFGNAFILSDWNGEIRVPTDDELVARHHERMKSFSPDGGVMRVTPAKSNLRMVAQAGEFLMPITLRRSFEANLLAEVDGKKCSPEVVKLVIPRARGNEFIRKLAEMNITYQTVYPDVSGLAMSVNI